MGSDRAPGRDRGRRVEAAADGTGRDLRPRQARHAGARARRGARVIEWTRSRPRRSGQGAHVARRRLPGCRRRARRRGRLAREHGRDARRGPRPPAPRAGRAAARRSPLSIPARKGPTVLIDAGANADNRPEHLLQFAIMGVDLRRRDARRASARVRLLSIGEEPEKGSQLALEAHALLRAAAIGSPATPRAATSSAAPRTSSSPTASPAT